jgi:A/G-specific adenine glycosylase
MGSMLPFGRTQVTASEYRQLINKDEIVGHLESRDISKPEERVTSFIETIPDLLDWLEENGRDYPWRYTTDPWRVYVTEILLQRTRADAVADIYESFFNTFPDPPTLASADETTIFEEIQSLGFGNQRTRSLRDTAQTCVRESGGTVPEDLETLQEPWRVGPYSARACLLFAFDTPLALVDSNITRIFERVFDYEMSGQPHKSDAVYAFVETFIPDDPALARAINFSFLDLGAILCTSDPQCPSCPLNECCAFAQQTSSE